MERETKEITTKNGHKVVIKSYLTYAEMEPILEKEGVSNIKKSAEVVRAAIVSVDGVSENAYDVLASLPFPEYSEVSKEVTSLISEDFQKAE